MIDMPPETATNRFGYGARPGEIARASRDPAGWLLAQLQPLAFAPGVGDSSAVHALVGEFFAQRNALKGAKSAAGDTARGGAGAVTEQVPARREIVKLAHAITLDTLGAAIGTEAPFAARLLDFFSNHFSVSGNNIAMRGYAPTLEREAIAPHLAGRFEHMLLAVEQHPAMLMYLNNEQSIGPASRVGNRRGKGLNENLAREILELHTLGVDGGYAQADVRELALAITGWSVGLAARREAPGFFYRADRHEPGARRLLGASYPPGAREQGEAMLTALARHPATARHLAFKLARHFVADEPPAALVDALRARWTDTGGDLREVLAVLVGHPLAREPLPRKLKTPRDFVISAWRASGMPVRANAGLLDTLGALGQRPFEAGSPAGFGDVASAWDGAEALMLRIDWAGQLGARIRGEPLAIASAALGSQLTQHTAQAIRRAESRQQAIALLLMSPEFQRR